LLGSDAAQDLLREFRDSYDFVLVDTPALHRFADAVAIGRFLDAALLVVRLEHTARPRIERSLDLLRQLDVSVLGCILTGDNTPTPASRYYAKAEHGEPVP
jgi:Mrp family chromosome partitioning ATPase